MAWNSLRLHGDVFLCRDDPELSVNIKGLTFHTPVGLAAGFDKNAEAPLNFCKYACYNHHSLTGPALLCVASSRLLEVIDNCRALMSGGR